MTTPPELLLLAEKLRQGSTEAEWRAAASRAYYAIYHHARAFHDSLPESGQPAPKGAGGDHVDLSHRLKNPAQSVNAKLTTQSRRIGIMLDNCRPTRHQADYEIRNAFSADQADELLAMAERIFSM